ncbi:MAG: hydroxyacylglutathione hydrolase [Betaproteobacteria bacterium]|nr:MAG: hydroxyacylglutathione hydrolase [Betaproteobacteria bacterium]
MLEITPIPAFEDNYIWALINRAAGTAVLVDPGDARPVEAFLAAHSLSLTGILITHHHGDHIGGIAALRADRAIPVFGPANESIASLTDRLRDSDKRQLPGNTTYAVSVLEVPGHTAGHIAYRVDEHLFCGDTLFVMGCGRLFEGTPAQLYASLQRIASLPAHTQLFCAHEYTLSNLKFALTVEPSNEALQARAFKVASLRESGLPTVPTTVAEELETNPYLRCHSAEIRANAEQFAGSSLANEVEVFAALRRWKNEFR